MTSQPEPPTHLAWHERATIMLLMLGLVVTMGLSLVFEDVGRTDAQELQATFLTGFFLAVRQYECQRSEVPMPTLTADSIHRLFQGRHAITVDLTCEALAAMTQGAD